MIQYRKKVAWKKNRRFNVLIKYVKNNYLTLLLVVFLLFILILLYNGVKDKDLTIFAYSIFVGNSIICNALFALGRSFIFIDTYKEREQKLIYSSAVMFLCSSMIFLLLSGFAYISTDTNFFGNTGWTGATKYIGGFAFATLVALCLTGIGFFYFLKWVLIALIRYLSKVMKKNYKEIEEENL